MKKEKGENVKLVDFGKVNILEVYSLKYVQIRSLKNMSKLPCMTVSVVGGKNAIIVDSDADLDEAVSGIVASAFGFQGQKCSAASRVIAVGDVHDILIKRLVEATRSLRIGMPDDPGSFIGPVISDQQRKKINKAIEDGKKIKVSFFNSFIESR